MITAALAARADALREAGVAFAYATVVRAQHPTSVNAGDTAIVLCDGTIEGFVGGVCAEGSVRLHGLRVLETGEPLLLKLLPDAPDDEDATPARVQEGAVVSHNPCLSGGALEIFLEPCLPAARLVVVGDAPVARALDDLGSRVGFRVIPRAAGSATADAGAAALVVASHGRGEEAVLCAALREGVPYVGLVASERRGAHVRAALDVPEALRERLRTPVGLDIGARTPAEIALAILAEIVQARTRAGATDAPVTAAAPVPQTAPSGGACCHADDGR